MLFREDYRHPCVDLSYKIIRIASDDRAGPQPLVCRWIFPSFPKASEHEGRIVLHANREWDLHPADCAPLVKAVSRNQPPTLLKCLAVRRRCVDSFRSRIDGLVTNLWIFGPVRD